MLQKLRDKTTGWIATVIIIVLIIPFAFFGLDQYMVGGGGTNVATVKAPPKWWSNAPSFWPVSMLWTDEAITAEEFRIRLEQVRQRQRELQGEAFDGRAFEQTANKLSVLDGLIDEQAQALAAERAGIVVSDAMVRETIQQIPAFQVDGRFDAQRYQLALASQMPPQTPAQFDQVVRANLQQSLLANAVASSSFITPAEMDRLLRLMGERRDVTLLVAQPAADEAQPAPSDADIQAWYDAHVADYRAPERVSIEYIELSEAALPLPAPADEATLRERYAQQQERFSAQSERLASHILIEVPADATPAEQEAAEARAREVAALARGEDADFAALAAEHSDDTGSSSAGGDLGWLSREMMPAAFDETLFALEPGQVGEPVRSEFGWHVIQLRDVRGGETRSFEDAREALAAEQAEADREAVFNEASGQIVDSVLENPTDLASAAAAVGVPVQTLGPFTRDSAPGVAGNAAVRNAAFSEALTQDGTVSDPISIGPGHSVWIRVTEHQPEQAMPLEQVRDRVVAAIRADRARDEAAARADALVERLRAGEDLAALAEAEGLPEPRPVPGVQRGMPLVSPQVASAIFAVQPSAEGQPVAGSHVLEDGSFVLFTVDGIEPGNPAEIPPEQADMLRQQLVQAGGYDEVRGVVARLRERLVIRINEQNL